MKCSPTRTPDEVDIPALRVKYRQERDKRMRTDGTAQFVETTGAFAHFYEADPNAAPIKRAPLSIDTDVAILGAGFAGMMVGAYLKRAGINDIRIIDMSGDFGGTWYWNRYPGVQCDVESYSYLPMLEETNYIPKDRYAFGPEIFEHCQRIGRHFGLYENALFGTIIRAVRWDEAIKRWRLTTNHGDDIRARFFVMCPGQLAKPKLPGIPGIETFKGRAFHTSRWDFDYTGGDSTGGMTKLADKRVAIIGTGSTGIQVVPFIAQDTEHLYIFQRTPSYILERDNRPTDPEWARSLRPGWQSIRQAVFHNTSSNGTLKPGEEDIICDGWTEINRNLAATLGKMGEPNLSPEEMLKLRELEEYKVTERLRGRIDAVVKDKQKNEMLKPWYRFRCKRPCFNDEYLDTFNRPNVTLVDVSASKGVERITESGLVANGVEYKVDCIVYASGFEITTDFKRRFGLEAIEGRDGRSLYDTWANGYKTLHGFMAHGFPNQFHTGFTQVAVVGSITLMFEHQARHISYIIREALKRGVTTVEPSQEGQEAWLRHSRENSVFNPRFAQECTPSYFNGEGAETTRSPLFGDLYGPGYEAFEEMLQAWRDKGDMAGLTLGN